MVLAKEIIHDVVASFVTLKGDG